MKQTLANPPGSYICMTHRAASVLHTSEAAQNTFFNSAARSMQNVLTVAICQGKSVNGVWRDLTCVNENIAQLILQVAGNTFWHIAKLSFAAITQKKFQGSKQTLSLSECTIEIFSHLGSLNLCNTPPPYPTLLSHLLSWKPQLWKDRTEAADWDWPVSLWLKTAMVCPPTPCMVNGWSFGTSGDPSFSPVAPRAVSSSLRLNRTWGTQMTVKNRQRAWRHITLG